MRPIAKGLTAAAVAVGIVGALHLPVLRPLLRAAAGGCPLGLDRQLTREELDHARSVALAADRGTAPADGRPALGFALGEATHPALLGWTLDHGLDCVDQGRTLRCRDVPGLPELPAPVDQLLLQFDAADRLVAVDVTLRSTDPDAAAAAVRALSARVAEQAGPASSSRGEATGAFLSRGALNQAGSSFRFEDYRADVSATNLGGRFVVRATFQSVG
jgi:hypothetical protein